MATKRELLMGKPVPKKSSDHVIILQKAHLCN